MEIVEIFAGTDADPDAQYVMLRTTAAGQQFVDGATIETSADTFGTFNGDVPGASAAGSPILMAAAEAATLFSIGADETADGTVPLEFPDGTVLFRCGATAWDTVRYGNVGGSIAPALVRGCALRKVGTSWILADPEPENSAGDTGTLAGSCGVDGGLADMAVQPDAGADDGAADDAQDDGATSDGGVVGLSPAEDEGCACAVGSSPSSLPWMGAVLALLLFRRRALR